MHVIACNYEGCNATARLRRPVNHNNARYRASHENGMFAALVRATACRIVSQSTTPPLPTWVL